MAKYGSLNTPVTNPQASQRIADTQALRARQMVGQQQTASTAPAAQAGAALTAQAGQTALQNQAQSAGLAKAQTGQQMQAQQQASQKRIFNQSQELSKEARLLDESLFNLSQEAATKEQDMRNRFANGQAQTKFLQEQELADWAVLNSENEQEFKDKIQTMELAHAKKAAMIDQAYAVITQDLKQKAAKADREESKKLNEELMQIQKAWEAEMTKRKNEAANRKAMWAAGGTILGAGLGALTLLGGPATAALAPVAISAGASAGGSLGTLAETQT